LRSGRVLAATRPAAARPKRGDGADEVERHDHPHEHRSDGGAEQHAEVAGGEVDARLL
jgi:hypothetical protein